MTPLHEFIFLQLHFLSETMRILLIVSIAFYIAGSEEEQPTPDGLLRTSSYDPVTEPVTDESSDALTPTSTPKAIVEATSTSKTIVEVTSTPQATDNSTLPTSYAQVPLPSYRNTTTNATSAILYPSFAFSFAPQQSTTPVPSSALSKDVESASILALLVFGTAENVLAIAVIVSFAILGLTLVGVCIVQARQRHAIRDLRSLPSSSSSPASIPMAADRPSEPDSAFDSASVPV